MKMSTDWPVMAIFQKLTTTRYDSRVKKDEVPFNPFLGPDVIWPG